MAIFPFMSNSVHLVLSNHLANEPELPKPEFKSRRGHKKDSHENETSFLYHAIIIHFLFKNRRYHFFTG